MIARIDYRGGERAQRALRDRAQRMLDLSPVTRVYASRLDTLIDDSFEFAKSPGGNPWADLQEETVDRRQDKRGAGPVRILQDTARLRRGWNARGKRLSILFSNDAVYMPAHQFGSGPVPAREQAPVQSIGGRIVAMRTGAAGKFFRDLSRAIRTYIATGRVRG